jgi:TPR repeat protein
MKATISASRQWRMTVSSILLLSFAFGAAAQEIMRFPRLQPEQVKRAAEENQALALFVYGSLLLHGDVTRAATPGDGLRYIERAAELGVARAQLAAAQLYRDGDTIPQNDAKALQWYRQAALQGIADAQYGLAALYETGIGTPVNLTEAARWYMHAATQGHPAAQTRIGTFYITGSGLKQDAITGYMWLTLAAASGHRPGIEARDAARTSLSANDIARAQQLAATFRPQPHYNASMIAQERKELIALAQELGKKPIDEETSR